MADPGKKSTATVATSTSGRSCRILAHDQMSRLPTSTQLPACASTARLAATMPGDVRELTMTSGACASATARSVANPRLRLSSREPRPSRRRAQARLLGPPAVPETRAPASAVTWVKAWPSPPVMACTSTCCPRRTVSRQAMAVRKTVGVVAAAAGHMPGGTAAMVSVGTTASIANEPVACPNTSSPTLT